MADKIFIVCLVIVLACILTGTITPIAIKGLALAIEATKDAINDLKQAIGGTDNDKD